MTLAKAAGYVLDDIASTKPGRDLLAAGVIAWKTISPLSPSFAAEAARAAKTSISGVKECSTTIDLVRRIASSAAPSELSAITTAPYVSDAIVLEVSSVDSSAASIARAVSIPPNPSCAPLEDRPLRQLTTQALPSSGGMT